MQKYVDDKAREWFKEPDFYTKYKQRLKGGHSVGRANQNGERKEEGIS
ncbi:MAG TPA: hypothetical protein IAC41_06895 [Candidatus Merdenecus merdavium]|nr:hypothetical protein [Candidatus Merdenecus merdavium]